MLTVDGTFPMQASPSTFKGQQNDRTLEAMAEASESRDRSILKPFPDKHGCRPGISDFCLG
jgi:hypothetical protein